MKNIVTTLLVAIALIVSVSSVSADSGDEKVECTTGAYGQQTCKTVEQKKDDRVLGEKMEEKVDAGLTENVMFAVAGLAIVSTTGLAYSRK